MVFNVSRPIFRSPGEIRPQFLLVLFQDIYTKTAGLLQEAMGMGTVGDADHDSGGIEAYGGEGVSRHGMGLALIVQGRYNSHAGGELS